MPRKTKQKHNWQAIRAEYIEASSDAARPTLEALATSHGCSPSYLREKAAAEDWKAQAEAYLKTIDSKRQEQKTTIVAGEQARWDQQCYKLAQASLQQIYTHLKVATEGKTLDPKTLKELTHTLEQLHRLGKAALGDEKPVETSATIDPQNYSTLSADELAQLYLERTKQPERSK